METQSHWQLVCLTQEHERSKARKDLNERIEGGKIRGGCPSCFTGHWQQECAYLNLRIRMDRGILGNFSHCSLPSWPGKTCECPIVNSKFLLIFCCCFEIGSCYVALVGLELSMRPVGLKLMSNPLVSVSYLGLQVCTLYAWHYNMLQ